MTTELDKLELYAYIGEDEFGSGKIGLKQGVVPAGTIALVSLDMEKLVVLLPKLEAQAKQYGKRIRLVKFRFAEVVLETEAGS